MIISLLYGLDSHLLNHLHKSHHDDDHHHTDLHHIYLQRSRSNIWTSHKHDHLYQSHRDHNDCRSPWSLVSVRTHGDDWRTVERTLWPTLMIVHRRNIFITRGQRGFFVEFLEKGIFWRLWKWKLSAHNISIVPSSPLSLLSTTFKLLQCSQF